MYRLAGRRKSGTVFFAVACMALLTMGAVRLNTEGLTRLWEQITNVQTCHNCGRQGASKTAVTQSSAGTFTNFDVTGAGTTALEGTFATSINASGEVAGIYITSGNVSHGFVRSASGTIATFDTANAGKSNDQGTFPLSIDDDGNITGMYADSSNVYHGFIRTSGGTITEFDAPGAGTSGHRGTSPITINSGVITGAYVTGSDATTSVWHGFIRAANGSITAPIDVPGAGTGNKQGTQPASINASGVITGTYTDSSGVRHGFIDAAGKFTNPIDPAGSVATIPVSIDAAGDIAGVCLDSTELMHGFVRTASGTITTFSAPGASTTPPGSGKGLHLDGTIAGRINTSASIVGFYTDSNKVGHGFMRASDGTFTSPLDDSEAGTGTMEGTASLSINDSGIVAGSYVDTSDVVHGFVFTPGAATVTLTPATLSFGNQAVDTTSAAKSVTVKNTGSTTLDITSIAAGGTFAISAKTCGTTLAAGKTCKVSVTFSPTAPGSDTGLLSVTDNASNSPQTAALSGTGVVQAKLTPASATYAKQKVGTTSAAKTFTLTNDLASPLTGIAISTSRGFCGLGDYLHDKSGGQGEVHNHVAFTPKATGARTGQLSVKDSASNSPQTSSLSGTGD